MIGPVAERVLLDKKTIPVRIDAVISGTPTIFGSGVEGSLISFRLKVSQTEDIPIPEDQIHHMEEEIKKGFLRRF